MQLYRYFSLFSCNYIKNYSPWLPKEFCLFSHSNSNYFNWITLLKAEKWQQQQTTKTKCKGSLICKYQGFPGGSAGKESACNAGDPGSIPGSGRSLGEGIDYPLQCSCLENPRRQRSLVGYSPQSHKESNATEDTEHRTETGAQVHIPNLQFFPLPTTLLYKT